MKEKCIYSLSYIKQKQYGMLQLEEQTPYISQILLSRDLRELTGLTNMVLQIVISSFSCVKPPRAIGN